MRLGKLPYQFLILVVALLLSGCAGTPPKPACEGATCAPVTTTIPTSSPIVIPPIDYPIDAPKVVQFEGCDGGIGLASVPIEDAQKVVPDDFDITYALSAVPRTASIQTMGIACARVVVNTTILENVSWFRVAVFVTPKNESWRGDGINHYLVDGWFSSSALAEWFKPTGVPAESAVFHREGVPSGSGARTDRWNVDGATCDLDTEFHVSGQEASPADETFYLWAGSKPYHRTEIFEKWVNDADPTSAAPLGVKGDCPSQRLFGSIPIHATRYQAQYEASFSMTGKIFG